MRTRSTCRIRGCGSAVKVDPSHDRGEVPPSGKALTAPFTKAQITRLVRATRHQLLADVLLALSGSKSSVLQCFLVLSAGARIAAEGAGCPVRFGVQRARLANYANSQWRCCLGNGLASDSGWHCGVGAV